MTSEFSVKCQHKSKKKIWHNLSNVTNYDNDKVNFTFSNIKKARVDYHFFGTELDTVIADISRNGL